MNRVSSLGFERLVYRSIQFNKKKKKKNKSTYGSFPKKTVKWIFTTVLCPARMRYLSEGIIINQRLYDHQKNLFTEIFYSDVT